MKTPMKKRIKTIEVEEQYWDLTRDQLLALKVAMRGGNASHDNMQLLNHAAGLLKGHDGIATALRERAVFLANGIQQIDDLLWPPAQS